MPFRRGQKVRVCNQGHKRFDKTATIETSDNEGSHVLVHFDGDEDGWCLVMPVRYLEAVEEKTSCH